MEKRILGRSDLAIAPIMLGGNVFGWTADAQTSFRILDAFVDAGFNAVDTADVYSSFAPGLSGGESETVIGDWLASRGRRDVWVEAKLNPRGLRILSALDLVAAAHAASPGQIALAWLLAQPGVTAPIVSAKSVEQLDDVLGAAGVVLDETQIAALTAASGED